MLPPNPFHGVPRHPVPNYIRRDFDDLPLDIRPARVRRLRIPVWPGFRLSITFERVVPVGGQHV